MVISAKTTLAATLLALVVPASASAAEIREHPTDTLRTDVARVEWTGNPADEVFVEYRWGLVWVTQASDIAPRDEGESVLSAGWQPARHSLTGTYRFRIETAGETLVSDEFRVRPCECVIPNQLRWRWRDGRFRLRLTSDYVPAGVGEFRLAGGRVETGRPVVRVLKQGRRVGSVRLRYKRGAFRATWRARRGPKASVVFQLVSWTDGFGNS